MLTLWQLKQLRRIHHLHQYQQPDQTQKKEETSWISLSPIHMHLTTWTIIISKFEDSQTNQQTKQSDNNLSMPVEI